MNKKRIIKYEGIKQKYISHFHSLRFFEYEVQLDEDRVGIFRLNSVPEWLGQSVNSAIITASNPKGFSDAYKKYLQDNNALNRELKIFIEILNVPFYNVKRHSISQRMLERDGCEITDAFLLLGITEADVKEIALQHWQEHFLFFKVKPEITITLFGCGKRLDGMREAIFP